MAKIRIVGDSSGYVEIAAPNAAGNNTLELPSSGTRLTAADSSGNLSVSGILTVSAGSTSIPSISPSGDSNTGIFFPSADTIAFAEGGSEAARFDSSGRLGIGTANPQQLLTLNQSTASHRILAINRANSATPALYLGNDSSENAVISANNSDIRLGYDFQTTFNETVRITSSGNVGIGTATNNVFDGVAASRPFLVQSSSNATTLSNSTNSITICNSDTTTSNSSQINFAAITGASANQYSSAIISAIHGARTNGQYPAGQLVFLTSSATNFAPSEKLRIDSTGYISTPNNLGAGLDIGYKRYASVTGTYSANTWYNTGISWDNGDTGIFLLNAYVDTYATGGITYQTTYTGLFVIPNRATNDSRRVTFPVHYSGHAQNGEVLQFSTLISGSNSPGIQLQWLSSANYTVALNNTGGRQLYVAVHRLATALFN